MKRIFRIRYLPLRFFTFISFLWGFIKFGLSPKIIWPITAVAISLSYFFDSKGNDSLATIFTVAGIVLLVLSEEQIASKLEYKLSSLGAFPSLIVSIGICLGSFWKFYIDKSENAIYLMTLLSIFCFGIWGVLFTIIRVFRRQKPILFLNPLKWPSIWKQWGIMKLMTVKNVFRMVIVLQCIVIVVLWLRVGKLEKQTGIRSWMCDEQSSIDTTKKAIVRIAAKDGEGTGFFIHPEGVILTNAHVIGDDIAPKIIFADYTFTTARVFARFTKEDMAVLQVDKKDVPYLSLSKDEIIQPQEELFIVGYPLGTSMRGEPTVVRKQYMASRTFKDDPVTYLQTELGLDGGISGSPVINACGAVVGMATMGTDATSMAISSTSILDTVQPADPEAVIGQLPEEKRDLKDSFDLPSEAVIAFYDAIRARRFRLAYDLMSKDRIKNIPFEEWIKGYANTMDATVVDFLDIKEKPGVVSIRLRAIDLVGQDMVMTYYEGEWAVVKEDNAWKLGDSNIKKIAQPPWWAWW